MTASAPYPADTRAKGWRFELDHERICEKSATWQLAPAELRPWLLMLWMTAWRQSPCGSLDNDDALIAARIGMPAKAFAKHRAILMRGWWQADDGRLYHDTITERVLHMLDKRANDAQRAANRRGRAAASQASLPGVTQESRVTPTGVPPEFDTKHQAPSTRKTNPPSPSAKSPPCPDGVDPGVWSDWLALRKAKRAPVTATVVAEAEAESAKAGLTLEAFLRVWCGRGSQGLQADWLKPAERGKPANGHAAEPAWRAEQRERTEAFAGPAAAKRRTTETVVEMPHVAARLG